MNNDEFIAYLKQNEYCEEALYWIGDRDLHTAWEECPESDWMLWLAGKANVEAKSIVLATAAIARFALPYTSNPCISHCLETVERWCHGAATIAEVVGVDGDEVGARGGPGLGRRDGKRISIE